MNSILIKKHYGLHLTKEIKQPFIALSVLEISLNRALRFIIQHQQVNKSVIFNLNWERVNGFDMLYIYTLLKNKELYKKKQTAFFSLTPKKEFISSLASLHR